MVKKKTHEEFVSEVYNLVGEEYTVLGMYKTAVAPIEIRHNNESCGNHKFPVKPNHFLGGTRCTECAGNKKKTTDKFKQEVFNLVGDEFEVVGNHVNAKTAIEMFHKLCGQTIAISPDSFLRGNRCKVCSGNMKKDTGIFKKEVHNLVGDEYVVLGEYVNNKEVIKILHKECGNPWGFTPGSFLHKGSRCPYCNPSYKFKLTQKEVKKRYSDEGYTLISEYKNAFAHITVICPKGHEWKHSHTNFQRGARCFECNGTKKHTLEEVRAFFIERNFNPLFEKYTDNKQLLPFICNRHPNYGVQYGSLHNLLRGLASCQVCYRNKFRGENSSNWKGGLSKVTKVIRDYIFNKWTLPSLEKYNYRCCFTGDTKKLHVHHINKSFHEILEEALSLLKF
ncbi:hypothetical protein [Bacillus pseudomycoides]|uniref:Zinc-ribbon domain-containing protein n=1 Tax=Bacillus pseudomycoides TaxID=64104 RepID=A0AAJ2DP25_9BACI|nr:hypothetical protein [Bacillus pseudomycoides]MDR4329366.1 hypothetical protein [Bacillus pseudomycoides]MED1535675.1 hypothetical protein [Bacillus pseudomycoides]PFZ91876.1 hypothetical protein COL70_11555 [Bacillus pseudomycoides]PHD08123.1 hypothetical protein COF46_23715 [Bacillus pseudomycoides]